MGYRFKDEEQQLYSPQVNKVLRNHHIKPHWMFAMDNIIRRAVQAAVTILIPGEVCSAMDVCLGQLMASM